MSRLPLNTGSQHLDSTSQGSPRTDGGDDSPHQSQSAFENQKTLGFPSSSSRMLRLDNRKTSGSPAPTWPHAYNFSLPPKTHFLRLAIDRAFNARKINIKLTKSAPCLGKNNKPLAPLIAHNAVWLHVDTREQECLRTFSTRWPPDSIYGFVSIQWLCAKDRHSQGPYTLSYKYFKRGAWPNSRTMTPAYLSVLNLMYWTPALRTAGSLMIRNVFSCPRLAPGRWTHSSEVSRWGQTDKHGCVENHTSKPSCWWVSLCPATSVGKFLLHSEKTAVSKLLLYFKRINPEPKENYIVNGRQDDKEEEISELINWLVASQQPD